MLISEKIKKSIETEVKSQKNLLKLLDNQEKNYKVDLKQEKENIATSITYYEKVLSEVA